MGDQVDVVYVIPTTCQVEGCERAPVLVLGLIEMSGLVMDEMFVCADHQAEARVRLSK